MGEGFPLQTRRVCNKVCPRLAAARGCVAPDLID